MENCPSWQSQQPPNPRSPWRKTVFFPLRQSWTNYQRGVCFFKICCIGIKVLAKKPYGQWDKTCTSRIVPFSVGEYTFWKKNKQVSLGDTLDLVNFPSLLVLKLALSERDGEPVYPWPLPFFNHLPMSKIKEDPSLPSFEHLVRCGFWRIWLLLIGLTMK